MNRNTLLPLLVIALLGYLVFGAKYVGNYMCGVSTITSAVSGAATNSFMPTKIKKGLWNVSDDNSFQSSADSYFGFINSKFDYIKPIDDNLKQHCTQTATYLNNNPERSLNITGYYSKDENDESIFPNLGLARANTIKEYMSSLGVAKNRMNTSAELVGPDRFNINKLEKGIEFSFTTSSTGTANTKVDDIRSRLYGKPLILYFGTGENYLRLDEEQKNNIADLIYYLDNVSESSLEINGHTDKKGKAAKNITLSKERAQYVKNYLFKNGGITMNRMVTNGFGEEQPLVKNNSSANRAKNRRVEVILK